MNLKKKILVYAIHYPVASGRYISRALRRMGHDVKSFGPPMGNLVWGMTLDSGYNWEPDALPGDWTPDLVITADSAYTLPAPAGVPHVLFGVDNHVRDYRLGVDFDYKFLAHSQGYRMEDTNTIWLPCAYDREYFHKDKQTFHRAVHAGMIGVGYQRRQEVMGALFDAGFEVAAALGLLYEQYNDFYNNCLVSVCVSAAGDVGQRIFETAAMGCVILSDRCHDFDQLGFIEGTHYLGFDSAEEAVEQMRNLLSMSDEAISQLANNGWHWALPHTWEARCQVILDTVFGVKS